MAPKSEEAKAKIIQRGRVPRERVIVAVKSEDIVMRDPKTMKRISHLGDEVELSIFWKRRLADGSVIKLKKKKQQPKADDGNGGEKGAKK